MNKITYREGDVGREVRLNNGKTFKIRKYHLTEEEKVLAIKKWEKETQTLDDNIVKKAHKTFFNPYRKGTYYYQIFSLFLLGANEWHSLGDIINKLEEIMSSVKITKHNKIITAWEQFKGRRHTEISNRCKDFIGRIQENMVFFQRLSKYNPTGYKLKQACGAVDLKRVSIPGFLNGCYYYRLSTYSTEEESYPIRDFSEFVFPKHEHKYINDKFIGTIITNKQKSPLKRKFFIPCEEIKESQIKVRFIEENSTTTFLPYRKEKVNKNEM